MSGTFTPSTEPLRVAVLAGGLSHERDVSLHSGNRVAQVLKHLGHSVLVLDVDALAARAPQLGDHVTLVRIHGGRHDLVLSQEEPRRRFLDEIRRWLATYGPGSA